MRRLIAMSRPLGVAVCLAIALPRSVAEGPVPPPPAQAPPRAATPYVPPDSNRILEATEAEPRPLLRALRSAGDLLGKRDWTRRSSVEMGTSVIDRDLANYFEKERLQKLAAGFKEGWTEVFVALPGFVSLQVVEMGDPETAHDFYLLNLDVLKEQLQALNQAEDSQVTVTGEGEIRLAGVDEAWEKQYEQKLADLPTATRYRAILARSGRYYLNAAFVQSDISADTAHQTVEGLASRVREAGAAGAS